MTQTNIKGSFLRVGDTVSVKIEQNEDTPATHIFGRVTGLRLWNTKTIAVEIAGVADWILLDDKTEVRLA